MGRKVWDGMELDWFGWNVRISMHGYSAVLGEQNISLHTLIFMSKLLATTTELMRTQDRIRNVS